MTKTQLFVRSCDPTYPPKRCKDNYSGQRTPLMLLWSWIRMTVSMPGGECLQSTAFCTGLFGDSETLLAVSVMSASPGKVFGFEGTGHGLLSNARQTCAS